MEIKIMSKSVNLSHKKFKKFLDKPYRDAYIGAHIKNNIAYQTRLMREQRNWTQQQLAEKADKTQNTISRLEDPSYGKLTIKTLLELASSFDVALLIKFVPFSDFLNETQALSAEALSAKSFTEELRENETLQLIEQQIQSTKVIIGSFGVDTHIKQTISVTTQTIQQPPQQAQLASTKIVEVGNKQNISLKTITA